ncbi:MAG: hypothetical protein IJW25_02530, partial [Clostridia bacterium]|nr:hypothetical protein [Clostridia bacterium]
HAATAPPQTANPIPHLYIAFTTVIVYFFPELCQVRTLVALSGGREFPLCALERSFVAKSTPFLKKLNFL